MTTSDLLRAIEASDVPVALEALGQRIVKGEKPWDIHLSLFPAVQRVLNPPFINPHLPKMYHICRELAHHLGQDEVYGLVRLEVTEYAKRPKLEMLPKPASSIKAASFGDIKSALRERDREKTALLMEAFQASHGASEFARRLLLLGSGYLDGSLGHSISCTAFILLEMMGRADQDPWPAVATLADYFCKGGFDSAPASEKWSVSDRKESYEQQVMRATSGRGIVNLHHTITLYAIERVRELFTEEQYNYLMGAWIEFMGDKETRQAEFEHAENARMTDYGEFFEAFSRLNARSVMPQMGGMVTSAEGRGQLGHFLVRALCDLYQGRYNPHYLTGLGSALWVMDRFRDHVPIQMNALFQYLDFFFTDMASVD